MMPRRACMLTITVLYAGVAADVCLAVAGVTAWATCPRGSDASVWVFLGMMLACSALATWFGSRVLAKAGRCWDAPDQEVQRVAGALASADAADGAAPVLRSSAP